MIFEVCNPLGTSRKKHKLCAIYWVIANLPVKYRSSLSSIYLALLCKSVDAKTFGYDRIVEPLLRDLQLLENQGIYISRLGTSVRGTVLNGSSDNLGAHSFAGFQESFNVDKFCHFCLASHSDIQTCSVQSKSFLLRTKESYNENISRLRDEWALEKCWQSEKRLCIEHIILLSLYKRFSSWLFTWPSRRYCSFWDLFVFEKIHCTKLIWSAATPPRRPKQNDCTVSTLQCYNSPHRPASIAPHSSFLSGRGERDPRNLYAVCPPVVDALHFMLPRSRTRQPVCLLWTPLPLPPVLSRWEQLHSEHIQSRATAHSNKAISRYYFPEVGNRSRCHNRTIKDGKIFLRSLKSCVGHRWWGHVHRGDESWCCDGEGRRRHHWHVPGPWGSSDPVWSERHPTCHCLADGSSFFSQHRLSKGTKVHIWSHSEGPDEHRWRTLFLTCAWFKKQTYHGSIFFL